MAPFPRTRQRRPLLSRYFLSLGQFLSKRRRSPFFLQFSQRYDNLGNFDFCYFFIAYSFTEILDSLSLNRIDQSECLSKKLPAHFLDIRKYTIFSFFLFRKNWIGFEIVRVEIIFFGTWILRFDSRIILKFLFIFFFFFWERQSLKWNWIGYK